MPHDPTAQCPQCLRTGPHPPDSVCPNYRDDATPARFVNVRASVMMGAVNVATARSSTMARRITAALNWYKAGPRGY